MSRSETKLPTVAINILRHIFFDAVTSWEYSRKSSDFIMSKQLAIRKCMAAIEAFVYKTDNSLFTIELLETNNEEVLVTLTFGNITDKDTHKHFILFVDNTYTELVIKEAEKDSLNLLGSMVVEKIRLS